MQIPDTDTPLILLALGVAMYHVPDPEHVEMEELERRIQALRGTDFEQINEDNTMSNDKTLATPITAWEVKDALAANELPPNGERIAMMEKALEQFAAGREGWHSATFEAINISPTSSPMDSVRRPNENLAITRRTWHSAVLAECTSIGSCYQESDPAKTVRDLIDWHRKDAVWHHEQEAAGRVASSPAPVSLPSAHDWLEQSFAAGDDEQWRAGWDAARNRLASLQNQQTRQASEPAPPENQSREQEADVAAQNYCRSMWGAARGYPDWRRYHDAFVAGYLAKPAPPAEMAKCSRCGGESAEACNSVGCFALECGQEPTQPVAQKADAEPMFWVRLRSDGGYEGPIHNDSIEAVRKASGAWTPLYTTPQAPALTDAELQSYEMHIAQATDIREILDALAPETEGNLQTRITQALTDSDRLDATILDWQPIESAPKNGSHILACNASVPFGYRDGKPMPPVQTVVHWWPYGYEGFYASVTELEGQEPFPCTHWKPLTFGPAAMAAKDAAA